MVSSRHFGWPGAMVFVCSQEFCAGGDGDGDGWLSHRRLYRRKFLKFEVSRPARDVKVAALVLRP